MRPSSPPTRRGRPWEGRAIIANFVLVLVQVLTAAIFLRAILSWFAIDPRNPLIQVLDQITEPILSPLRRIVPRIGMIDITPLVAIILLQVLGQALAQSL